MAAKQRDHVIIDIAGAAMGGAARYAAQLFNYMRTSDSANDVVVIGAERMLTGAWLVQREFRRFDASRSIAANNVSFATGADRVVILRNALHFLSDREHVELGRFAQRLAITSWLVRCAAARADRVVVPSQAMRDRVVRLLPEVDGRLVVLNHPVPWAQMQQRSTSGRLRLLCPVHDAPYKDLNLRLRLFMAAVAQCPHVELRVTSLLERSPEAGNIIALGRLDHAELEREMGAADAIVFPLALESFGYPMAEGRLRRIPVLSPPGPLAAEVAGDAHVECDFLDLDSIRAALVSAATTSLAPLVHNPFDPAAYFDTLFFGR